MRFQVLSQAVAIVLVASMVRPPMPIAQQADPNEPISPALGAVKNAATQGFFANAAEYDEMVRRLSAFRSRDLEKHPLTEIERADLRKLVEDLQAGIPIWIDRLIKEGKRLEADGVITFQNANWEVLRDECLDLTRRRGASKDPAPLATFLKGFDSIKDGRSFDWGTSPEDFKLESADCAKHVRVVLEQVSQARHALDKELAALASLINEKQQECDSKKTPEACGELDKLVEEFEDKTEQRTRLEKFEDHSKTNMAWLGALAIVVGVVVGVWCCPTIGASIAAWGGKTLDENWENTETRPVTETRRTGRKRTLEGAEGDATPEEREDLKNKLEQGGFKEVPYEGEGTVAVQIVSSSTEIRVYLVKLKQPIAIVSDSNTRILTNSRNVDSVFDIVNPSVSGKLFIDDNKVRLNVTGTGPDGAPLKAVIVERELGSRSYLLTVDE